MSAVDPRLLTEGQAKQLLHVKGRSRLDQLLLLLATEFAIKSVAEIKKLAVRCGLRAALRWNISDILRRSDGSAVLTNSGWELTGDGFARVSLIAGPQSQPTVVKKTVADVRKHLTKISHQDTRNFMEEAVGSFESGHYRAAVVLSWVGAVSVLQNHVLGSQLSKFNAEARRRDSKWKEIHSSDDFGRLKEHDFLDLLDAIGVLGKNVKQVLQNQCLNLRNACGHPNSLQISENSVAAHLDTLVLNVFSKY